MDITLPTFTRTRLGDPFPDQNIWEQAGEHQIWYATEEGVRHRLPKKTPR